MTQMLMPFTTIYTYQTEKIHQYIIFKLFFVPSWTATFGVINWKIEEIEEKRKQFHLFGNIAGNVNIFFENFYTSKSICNGENCWLIKHIRQTIQTRAFDIFHTWYWIFAFIKCLKFIAYSFSSILWSTSVFDNQELSFSQRLFPITVLFKNGDKNNMEILQTSHRLTNTDYKITLFIFDGGFQKL